MKPTKTISGCTIVRNAVKLNYPLEASILTYLPICKEVVIAYDPTSEDETEKYVKNLARKYKEIVLVPSPWNLDNHHDGTEITLQSNVAIEACTGDWGLYVQADEAIHEGDHQAILRAIEDPNVAGAVFERRSFLYTLEQDIPDYFARNLLRLYRKGEGFAIGDAMTCGLVEGVRGRVVDQHWRMYNYSRMGAKAEILTRCRDRDNFHHDTKQAVEANQKHEFTQKTAHYPAREHPAAIYHFYEAMGVATESQAAESQPRAAAPVEARFPVSLVALMRNEKDNVLPFLWQFREWEGDIVIIDWPSPRKVDTRARRE
ncbi:MAG: glycosyltransferase [Rhodanobacteraceae bacterium]